MIKSFFKKLGTRSQTGDTIIEVLISICILSVILAGSYVVANHSLQTGIDAAQRSEALALAQKQVEYIKYAANDSTAPASLLKAYEPSTNAPFCIVGTVPSSSPIQSTPCQVGAIPYKISTSYTDPTFTITVAWDAVSGHGQSQMILYYKLPGSYDAPLVDIPYWSDRTKDSVTLKGSINPMGNSYTYYFKYGTTKDFGNPPLTGGPFSDRTIHSVSASVTGLLPATTYYYQLCLSDSTCVEGQPFSTYGMASVGLSASPSTINQNETTTITWTPLYVSGCTASGAWSGSKTKLGNSTPFTLTSAGSYTYNISCTAEDPSQSPAINSTTVIVRPPPTLSFGADSTSLSYNGSTALRWRTTNSTWCWGSGGTWGGGLWKNPSGGNEGTGALTSSQTYRLQCGGDGGSTPPYSVIISVRPSSPTINSFTAGSYSLPSNGTTILYWSSSNTTWCWGWGSTWGTGGWISPPSGGATGIGPPLGSQTYNLKCGGDGGETPTYSVTISVFTPPTITGLTANPNPITAGNPTIISWTLNDVVNMWCTLMPNNIGVSLWVTVWPGSTTAYHITCYGLNDSSVTGSVTITVN